MMRHRTVAPSPSRLSELDSLRGIAALLVLFQHARVLGLDPRPFDHPMVEKVAHMLMHFSPLRVLEFGRGAVLFFFVLSGFLITVLLLQEWKAANAISLSHFYLRRALRLVPALIAAVAGAAGQWRGGAAPPC